ncbi:MAG: hypothetical protein MI923_20680 [Phycisphaerales bacterium]|nr:hypothetical protein [Phycisphaerales bacterium]
MIDAEPRLRRYTRWSLWTALFSQAFGCYQAPEMTIEQQSRGHVVMLPGVEGNQWQLAGTLDGLRDAGLDRGIEIIPWGTPPLHSLQNLSDLPANLKRAEERANRLVALQRERPDKPLTLIGFSGGGGLAILTIEALPKDVMLDRVILVAAAISKDYDLSKVLARCKDKVINIYSPKDGIVGFGTSLFGTIDRKRTLSAGHCGFLDNDGKQLRHEKLQQIAWEPAWRRYGHNGGHLGYLSRPWACHILAPQIDPLLNKVALAR